MFRILTLLPQTCRMPVTLSSILSMFQAEELGEDKRALYNALFLLGTSNHL